MPKQGDLTVGEPLPDMGGGLGASCDRVVQGFIPP